MQSTAVDPSIRCINTHRDPHAKTIFYLLLMTIPCFITTTDVVLLEKEGVTKPDVSNDCDWYVWRGYGKRYGVPRRNKHRRNNSYYYFYDVLHELLRKSMMMMRLHVCCCMYGNDEIYIYYSAINIIFNTSIT